MAGTVGGGVLLLAAYISDTGVGLKESVRYTIIQRIFRQLTFCRRGFDEAEQRSHYCRQSVSNGNSLRVYVQVVGQMHLRVAAPEIVHLFEVSFISMAAAKGGKLLGNAYSESLMKSRIFSSS